LLLFELLHSNVLKEIGIKFLHLYAKRFHCSDIQREKEIIFSQNFGREINFRAKNRLTHLSRRMKKVFFFFSKEKRDHLLTVMTSINKINLSDEVTLKCEMEKIDVEKSLGSIKSTLLSLD
jgi:hypothetical protein